MLATAVLTVPRHVSEWTMMSAQALTDGGELRTGNLWHKDIKWERNGFYTEKTSYGNYDQSPENFEFLLLRMCFSTYLTIKYQFSSVSRLLTCRRWRWSSVRESCSISLLFLSSSVISSSSSVMSLCALCSAAACFLWIISTSSDWFLSMERSREEKTSMLSITSLFEFSWGRWIRGKKKKECLKLKNTSLISFCRLVKCKCDFIYVFFWEKSQAPLLLHSDT